QTPRCPADLARLALWQPDRGQGALAALAPRAAIADLVQQREVVEVLLRRQMVRQTELLRQVADPAADVVAGEPLRPAAVMNRARGRLEHAREEAQQRRLAGAVRAENADHPLPCLEARRVERADLGPREIRAE